MALSNFYSRYNPPPQVVYHSDLPSMTKEEYGPEVDINNIIQRYQLGQLNLNQQGVEPWYGDATDVPDYHTAMSVINKAKENFDALPSAWRKRFGNSPGELLAFLADPANRTEAEQLGLINKPQAATPPPTPPPGGASNPAAAATGIQPAPPAPGNRGGLPPATGTGGP